MIAGREGSEGWQRAKGTDVRISTTELTLEPTETFSSLSFPSSINEAGVRLTP